MIKQQELVLFGVTIILNMKVTVIEKKLSVEKCFNKVRPYLKDIMNNLIKSDTRKI